MSSCWELVSPSLHLYFHNTELTVPTSETCAEDAMIHVQSPHTAWHRLPLLLPPNRPRVLKNPGEETRAGAPVAQSQHCFYSKAAHNNLPNPSGRLPAQIWKQTHRPTPTPISSPAPTPSPHASPRETCVSGLWTLHSACPSLLRQPSSPARGRVLGDLFLLNWRVVQGLTLLLTDHLTMSEPGKRKDTAKAASPPRDSVIPRAAGDPRPPQPAGQGAGRSRHRGPRPHRAGGADGPAAPALG